MKSGDGGSARTVKVKAHTRTIKPKPPAPKGDVQSSGGGYGLKRADKFKATAQFKADQQAAGKAGVSYALAKAAHPHALQKPPEHHSGVLATALGAARVAHAVASGPTGFVARPIIKTAKNILVAEAKHPVAVPVNTAKGLRNTVLDAPGGIAQMATQSPVKTAKQIVADYAKRYGETDAQQQKRFAKEGIAPELLDAVGAASAGGATAGRVLSSAAKAGKLGARAEEIATAARPALRTTGGAAKAQPLSDNFIRALAQRTLDTKRAAKQDKIVKATNYETDARAPAHRVEAARANATAGKTVEVTPLRGVGKAQRVGVAKLKSRSVHLLRSEQGHRIEHVARTKLNQLTPHERDAFYAVAEGWAPAVPAKAVAHLEKRKADILAHRAANETGPVRRRTDEVRKIDSLIQHADKAFTPRLGQVVRDLRAQDIHVGAADPGTSAAQRLLRRYGPQASQLGLERGIIEHVTPPKYSLKKTGEQSIPFNHEPHALHFKPNGKKEWGRGILYPDGRVITGPESELTHKQLAVAHGQGGKNFDIKPNGEISPRMLKAEDVPKVLAADSRLNYGDWKPASSALDVGQYARTTKVPGMRYTAEESVPAYIKRVQKAADAAGLERPLYFPHERDPLALNPDRASRAVGGSKAVAAPFQNTYKLFNQGRRDTSPDVYLTGLARTIKRRHNWNLVADQYDRNTFAGLRNMPLSALKAELTKRGIDAKDVAFWNAGRYRRNLAEGQLTAMEKPNRYGDALTPAEEHALEQVQPALKYATHNATDPIPTELAKTGGWSAVPKAVHDEITATAIGEGKAARAWDVMKGKQSRLLLGANPAWNAFQVISNVALGTAATKGMLPLRLAQQSRLYRALDPQARELVDAVVGEGGGAHGNQAKLGAAANSKLVNRYRELKASPALDKKLLKGHGPTARQLNPVEAGFAFDRLQNAQFRRALLVHSLASQGRKLDSATVKQMLKDPAKAEQHAKLMNDWLGDYITYTARERKTLARYPMFYGYLRHSTRLLFKTLPADHPLLLAATLYLGQLQRNELKKLGLDGLPWSDGKYYFTTGGKLQEVNLGRANPLANAITSVHGWGQLLAFAPPVIQAVANQIATKDLYTGKDWKVYGHPAPYGAGESYFAAARPRVFFEDVASGFAPYRTASKLTMFGPQGADSSLLLGKRPIRHKDKKLRKADKQREAQDRANASVIHELFPLLPKASRDPQIAQSMADKNKKKPKKGRKSKAYFGGGSLGGGYGGSGLGGGYGGGGLNP